MSLSDAPSRPSEVLDLVANEPMTMHGKTVAIVRASCHCGGSYAWMVQRDTGAWEMKGCVCHNPALGV